MSSKRKTMAARRVAPTRYLTLRDLKGLDPIVPLVQSHGMGVNSTAVAVLLHERGIRPDLILFADTGEEHDETYDYLPIMNGWLRQHGLPQVQVVRKRSKYETLYDNCLGTDTLPSKAYGGSSCSQKWKVNPQEVRCNHWAPARACWGAGEKVVKVIGFDAGGRDTERYADAREAHAKKPDPDYDYVYPLLTEGLDREACKAIIRNAGLPVPRKSACWYCPASKWEEVVWLAKHDLAKLDRAIALEVNAAQGKHRPGTTRGLGRRWSWLERLCAEYPHLAGRYREELEVFRSHEVRRGK